jgi:hypothetical protein
MAGLLRCTVPHWQGDKFVAQGTILRDGHPDVIPDFFEPYDLGDDEPASKTTRRPRKND